MYKYVIDNKRENAHNEILTVNKLICDYGLITWQFD